MFLSYAQIVVLLTAIALLLISSLLFSKNKETHTLLTLVSGAFLLRLFMASIDPFLHSWDEHFHALVAKNLMQHPLMPTLNINPILPYNFKAWCCNYIWLHKQPLFLWQMALSMKLFGVNELALRLPSAIMGSITVLFVYRIGKLALNTPIAYIAALLFAVSNTLLEQVSGKAEVDHNNAAFLFYVTASIWALIEYDSSNTKRKTLWLLLIGLFAGGAVLNKWLIGLLVYAGWGIALLLNPQKRAQWLNYLHLSISFLITTVIALPWQLYILWHFPAESRYEYAYNSKHIWTVVEGHGGAWYIYLEKMGAHYGQGTQLLVLLGLIYWTRYATNAFAKQSLLACVLVIYTFFSLVSQTKMSSYVLPVAAIMYLLIAAGITFIFNPKNQTTNTKQNIAQWAFVAALSVYLFNPSKTLLNRWRDTNNSRANKIHNTQIYKKLDNLIPANCVVVNASNYEATDIMFYSNRQAYNWVSDEDVNKIIKSNYKVAVLKNANAQTYPNYTKENPNLILLNDNTK